MSESNQALVDALVKFQRWCDAGGPDLTAELARLQAALEEAEAKVRRIDAEDTADAKVLLAAFNRETVLKSQLTAAAERAERLTNGIKALHQQAASHPYPGIDTQFVAQELAALLHPTQEPSDGK